MSAKKRRNTRNTAATSHASVADVVTLLCVVKHGRVRACDYRYIWRKKTKKKRYSEMLGDIRLHLKIAGGIETTYLSACFGGGKRLAAYRYVEMSKGSV